MTVLPTIAGPVVTVGTAVVSIFQVVGASSVYIFSPESVVVVRDPVTLASVNGITSFALNINC